MVVHPLPPMSQELAQQQKEVFAFIAQKQKEIPELMVLGDFNSTPFSAVFRRYFMTGSWYSSEPNRYTWNVASPLTIPIDHVLSTKALRIEVSPQLNSDHN